MASPSKSLKMEVDKEKAGSHGDDVTAELHKKMSVYCWGNHNVGQLGLGGIEEECIYSPVKLNFMEGKEVLGISCGSNHTVFVMASGELYSCGANEYGQLGHNKGHKKPELIDALSSQVISTVSCGESHNVAMNSAGQLYTWGSNSCGQLGSGSMEPSFTQKPKLLRALATHNVVQVSCGACHTVALTDTGQIYAWGSNCFGQLGIGRTSQSCYDIPQLVASLKGMVARQLVTGGDHTFMLSVTGAIYGWGKNEFGQLGIGNEQNMFFPTHCKTLRSQKIRYIACGKDHTAMLTKDGGVFTFGAGQYGQLGHNTSSSESLPRKVFELMGSTVTQIACGRAHTLAYIASSQRLFSFGLSGNGQLGTGDCTKRMSPQIITAPFLQAMRSTDSTLEGSLYSMHVGGDQCLITVAQESCESLDFRESPTSTQVLTLSEENITRYSLTKPDQKNALLLEEIEKIFSSPSCVSGSFLIKNDDHYCSKTHHGVDLDAAKTGFEDIHTMKNHYVEEWIMGVVEKVLLPSLSPSPPDLEALRLYLVLPMMHCFANQPSCYDTIICPFARALLQLEGAAPKIMDQWWSTFKPSLFKRNVNIYKNVVIHVLQLPTPQSDFEILLRQRGLLLCMEVLKRLNTVNEASGQIIRYDQFYIPEIREKVSIREDYMNWIRQGTRGAGRSMLSFCDYPFVFNAEVKTVLLQMDAVTQMESAMDEVHRRNLSALFIPNINPVSPCLILYVTRDNIVNNTIEQLSKQGNCDFKKPLKVIILGEEALDAGGVRKEFFLLILREILHPKYGMFRYFEESRLIWFDEQTFEDGKMFELIGLICGLAIYNATIININFPLALYKKLLSKRILLEDLEELDPIVGKSLLSLLDYPDDDVEDTFGLTFSVMKEVYGEMRNVELIPNGSNIAVDNTNREKYVECYIDYLFNTSVKVQFDAFNEGFHRVCGGRVLDLFHPIELQSMVIGNEDYDWDELQKNTSYKGEYYANHHTIKIFWEVFRELNEPQKRKFLLFLTGSDRIPIHGMKAVKLFIQPTGGGESYFPVAHTCFNLLDLPKYENKDVLREKLLAAIEHSEGFTIV